MSNLSRFNPYMQIKHLMQDDDAVSPVIGVILMVAITVILAASHRSCSVSVTRHQYNAARRRRGMVIGSASNRFRRL